MTAVTMVTRVSRDFSESVSTHGMKQGPPPSLQIPSFLHGSFMTVARSTSKEGRRCGEQYRQDGSFPAPRTLLEVLPEEVVIVHEVADFERARPAWRLYLLSRVMAGLYEAMAFQNTLQVRDAYEAFCRESAWGALYFAVTHPGPASAERTALRLQALLRFWEPLQSVRYRFTAPNAALTLEDLARLELAVERLTRATRDDSVEAALRQLPRARAIELLLYDWDHQVGAQ
jgi:hypothetical protein